MVMLHESMRGGRSRHAFATPSRAAPRSETALAGLTVFFAVATFIVGWPFLAAIVFALWTAHLARPLYERIRRLSGGRDSAAGVVTALLLLCLVAPLALALVALVPAARGLFEQLRHASGGKGALQALVSDGSSAPQLDAQQLINLAKQYGAGASRALATLATASLEALVGAFVYFAVVFAVLVDGDQWWAWVRAHAPLERPTSDRLRGAFHQAGKGLIVGTGLTALVQGLLAGILYGAFGVPRAVLLGMLSVVAALIPMTGPMLVWIPVSLGLALTGQPGKAAALAAVCLGLVGTIDNVLRPWLSRRFDVGMPATIVLVAMLGGIVVFGGWGLLLGPLVVRLAAELFAICRERRTFGRYSNTP
jgi:predicted PurR-regulated permease PerM